jgi:UTP--glucose-1-phosphate uridylyltransferase
MHSGTGQASGASLDLVEKYEETELPCVGVSQVLEKDVCNYGVISFDGSKVSTIVEKPEPKDAPSNFALCGRYLFPRNTFEILEQYPISEFGENQSIALLRHLIENGGIEAVKYRDYQLYDSGNPISWMKAQIDHAFRRQDIGEEFRSWVQKRLFLGVSENDD